MALGVDAVVVRTPFEDFTVREERGRARPEGEQLELARWAASQFRFGFEMGLPHSFRQHASSCGLNECFGEETFRVSVIDRIRRPLAL